MVKASAKSHLLPLLSVVNKRKNYLFYRIFINKRTKMALGCDIRGPHFYAPFMPNHIRMKNLLHSSCRKFSFIADDNINRLTKTHTAFSLPYRHKSFLLLYWKAFHSKKINSRKLSSCDTTTYKQPIKTMQTTSQLQANYRTFCITLSRVLTQIILSLLMG